MAEVAEVAEVVEEVLEEVLVEVSTSQDSGASTRTKWA
jgi:hypothetical protein